MLQLDFTIFNPYVSANLDNVALQTGKYLADAVNGKKTSIGARSPLSSPLPLAMSTYEVGSDVNTLL